MKFLKILASQILLALFLISCSSMEVDTETAYGSQLPKDFDWEVFDKINPDIRLAQSVNTISSLNAKWEQDKEDAGEEQSAIDKLKEKYEDLFFGNTGNLTSPAAGIAKEYLQWTDGTIASSLTSSVNKTRLKKYNLYELFESNEKDKVASVLKSFIDNLPIDSDVFSMTYALGGKKNGRPYRECKPEEKAGMLRKDLEGIVDYDYSKYVFCADTESPKPYPVYVIQ